ncbi:methyltransferase family protein [Jatrophihabitans sp. GAS493]|uniref:class I SAM-dependent methyltransferase n=1 Tax=Jatrophihabitans sp. GAS493 TaxID=1907575 RepID=UPI000BC0D9BB|nr:class I SAM-dependent methyltransferase [Jatrophihabitans sp. GAS493]SOD73649.1 methyltransferase family protein [Jatrophihabitans sp. GAS493]
MESETRWVGSMPETYDRCLGPALFEPYAVYLAGLAAELAPNRILEVLELAAGTGVTTVELLRRLPTATLTATDLNPSMVEWGRTQAPAARWQVADAQELDFADGAFDLVVCQFGVMFFPDRQRAYAEALRVLAAGGVLLVSSWDVVEKSAFPSALLTALAMLFPLDPPDFVSRVPHGYADPVQLAADVAAAGFGGVSVRPVALRGRVASAQVVTEGFCLGTPLRFALEARGELELLTDQLAVEMTSLLGEGPLTGDLAAHVIIARKP